MSRYYSINVTLDVKIDSNSIKKILERSIKEGFLFCNLDQILNDGNNKYYSLKESLEMVLVALEDIRLNPLTYKKNSSLYIKHSNVYFFMGFKERNSKLSLYFSAAGSKWYKRDSEDEEIDFDRYIRLLLDLCKDFKILELKTWDEYFNTPINSKHLNYE